MIAFSQFLLENIKAKDDWIYQIVTNYPNESQTASIAADYLDEKNIDEYLAKWLMTAYLYNFIRKDIRQNSVDIPNSDHILQQENALFFKDCFSNENLNSDFIKLYQILPLSNENANNNFCTFLDKIYHSAFYFLDYQLPNEPFPRLHLRTTGVQYNSPAAEGGLLYFTYVIKKDQITIFIGHNTNDKNIIGTMKLNDFIYPREFLYYLLSLIVDNRLLSKLHILNLKSR